MHHGDIKIQGMSKVARHKCELLEQLFLQLSIRRVMRLMRKRISTRVKGQYLKKCVTRSRTVVRPENYYHNDR